MGKPHRRLDGAIASPHDENLLVHVVVRLDQAVHDLWQFLSLDAELSRDSALAEREDHRVRPVLPFGGGDGENAVLSLFDIFHLLAFAEFELDFLQDFAPDGEEIFLGQFRLLEFSVDREVPPGSSAPISGADILTPCRRFRLRPR